MKFRCRIIGSNNHCRVDMVIDTDLASQVVLLRKYAERNKYQFKVEVTVV